MTRQFEGTEREFVYDSEAAEKPSRIDGMARSFDQWLNMVPHAVADGSKAQVECALADASNDIEVLWRKVTSQAAEIERLREERSWARAKALEERRAANDYAARLAEALKALEPFANAAGEWDADENDGFEFADSEPVANSSVTVGHLRAARRVREGGKVK